MKGLLSNIFSTMALCVCTSVMAASYNYKCSPVSVEIEDLSSAYLNEYILIITQNAKNTAEYNKQTTYPSTVELHLFPEEHSIAGTFSSADCSIGEYSFVQYNSNFRYLYAQAESFITIESRGGDKYALTGGKLTVRNNAGNIYTYNYCYAESDLNSKDAPVVPFVFTYTESPIPEQWDVLGTSTVTDSVVSFLSGNASTPHAYNVRTLQNGTSYKFVNLFWDGSTVSDATYTNTDITVNAADPDNVCIERQNTGWKNSVSGQDYFITATGGRYADGMIVFDASDCTADANGQPLDTPVGGLRFVMPGTPLEYDTIYVTATDCSKEYYTDSQDWMVILRDADGSLYGFDIYAPESGLEDGRTYSSWNRDFNPDFTYAWIGQDPDYAIKSTFSITEQDNGISVIACLYTESGHLYRITYQSGQTAVADIANLKSDDTPAIFSLDGKLLSKPSKGRICIINGRQTLGSPEIVWGQQEFSGENPQFRKR